MRRWPRLRFGDALVLSALPLLLAGYLVASAATAYSRAIQFDDWYALQVSVEGAFGDRLRSFVRMPKAAALEQQLAMDAPDAGIIRLDIPADDWTRFWADPQLEWGVWRDATLPREGGTLPVKVRKRGDNSVHWVGEKRSFTVRTPREEFFKRFRVFGLSVKDVIPSYLANRLGAEFGLLAPATEVVPVFINNRFSGVYRFLEPVDESFLRPFDRMPGNVYRADAAERSDFFKEVPPSVFANLNIWDRVSFNDRPTGPGTAQLRRFLEDVNGTRLEDHARLMNRLDRDELARLFAYLLLTGDPYHMDALHNQLWYEDPSSGLLHPIPWDTRLLPLARQDQRLSPVFRALLRDPFLVDAILRETERRLAGGILGVADSLAAEVEGRYPAALAYDRLRAGLIPDIGDSTRSLSVLRRNAHLLRSWMAADTIAVATGSAGNLTVLDFESRGYAGANLQALEFAGPTAADGVYLDRNQNGVLDAEDPRVPGTRRGNRLVLDQPVAILPAWRTDTIGVFPGRVAYRLFVRGTGSVRPVLVNRITGAASSVVAWGAPYGPATLSFSPWEFPLHRGSTHRWSGVMRLTETVRIPAGDTLRVAPGTTLRLGPDVSIVSRGLVLLEGTRAQPIEVIPDVPGRPWGTFAMQGSGADGTRVTWTRFFQGGGALVDGIEYIGMVNLHRTRGALFRQVTFERNVRSDDTFHVMHSDVVLDSSAFLEGNSDGLDMDISSGIVADNLFRNSGGDAIDLMTSTPLIYGNRMLGSGDKGVSVGEASSPLIFNNYIEGSRRGIEVKDRSDPVILNNRLVRNGVGVYQDRKNWRYGGGGWATLANTQFEDNGLDLKSDPFSRLTLAANPGLDSAVGAGAGWLARRAGVGGAPARPSLAWLYARYRLPPRADTAGPLAGIGPPHAPRPLDGERFEDDFKAYRDGWEVLGESAHLYKRDRSLILTAELRESVMELPVRWTVRPGEQRALVVEAATIDLLAATLEIDGAAGTIHQPLELTGDPKLFRLNQVLLPPGEYTRLRITARPQARNEKLAQRTGWLDQKPGSLTLRGWYSVAVPAVSGAPDVALAGDRP